MRFRRAVERGARILGVVLVLGTVPAARSEAQDVSGFVGYDAVATGKAFSAFPTIPALLPVEVPAEATVALATATLSSGGQGFGRASTFFPGTLLASIRPLIETAAGVRLPLPDYPLVAESRDFEGAKHIETPGITMISDVDPDRANATADVGAVGLPAVLGIRSLRTESTARVEAAKVTATTTTRVNGIEVGLLTIGSVVSTSTVTSDGTTSTCDTEVSVTDARVGGSRATINDTGIHVDDDTPIPGLGLGQTLAELLESGGLTARVLGGTESCDGASGSASAAGLLISLPLPAFGSVPAGGGVTVTVGSTAASAGASVLPPAGSIDTPAPSVDVIGGGIPDSFGDVPLPTTTPTVNRRAGTGTPTLPIEPASYEFDGVPIGLLVGLLLLAIPAATRLRRYMLRIFTLVGAQ